MATWKRFTGAVDSSAQSFLKNKKFSREKKTFTWDWHAWNLALVSTPSLLLAYYLHGVEKQMHKEAAIREEIQERTGVSSRGFLIPKREVREEVLGMLSAGNQRGSTTSGKDGEGEGQDEDGLGRELPADFESIQRRLAALESMLRVHGASNSEHAGVGPGKDSAPPSTPASSQGSKVTSASNTAREEESSRVEATQSTADKAVETASAAGWWVIRTGERQGRRLLQLGRDWLAQENRQEGPTPSEQSGLPKGETAEHHAAGVAVAEVPREELPSAEAADSLRASTTSNTGGDTAAVVSDSKGKEEGAWRRGRLDGNDKQR